MWMEVPDQVKLYVMNQVLRRSAIDRDNRAKMKIVHTSGARKKIEALQLQYESEGKPCTKVEIFAKVFGRKVGYLSGLGHSVQSVGSSSSVSSVDLARDWKRSDYR
ncbi:hypothetical protein CJ030_MR0G008574 [Morella rubra]|uniref:Uncharacterized protein n=1 Tax=Morella rubra TaxID=262757 RepID=A0A6A1UII0_9ROSI|nr:hypothetical protein CJ030_MR0G008574 [Morella rubra]